MTILFDATQTVKTSTPRTFGRGLLASRPVFHTEHTAADEAWAAAELNRDATDFDVIDFDALAAEAAAMASLEAGFCF